MRLNITDPAGMWDVVLGCVTNAEVQDREGNSGRTLRSALDALEPAGLTPTRT